MTTTVEGFSTRFSRRSITNSDEISMSGEAGDDKTIPFLRRLRDMLVENEEVITFCPGERSNGKVILGRIIVHDRVEVEASILPRYFNHSSFASLRRQLNYFSFVRVGKGRQRESTYVNEDVVVLDDVLNLKRRPAGSAPPSADDVLAMEESSGAETRIPHIKLTKKPRKLRKTATGIAIDRSPSVQNLISEDEGSDDSSAPFVQTLQQTITDKDILAGCNALLKLSKTNWN